MTQTRAPGDRQGDRQGGAGLDRTAQAALLDAVANRRDRQAFAALFAHFAPRLKGYLVRLGASEAAAEELVQESMLTVWRRATTFDPAKSSPSTWLFTIARNRRIDLLRRERRPEIDPEDPLLVPDQPRPQDEALGARQEGAQLQAAIAELPAEQRDLVELAFYQDLSHSEIAVARDLPLGTVKSRLRLALGRLRKAMDGLAEGDTAGPPPAGAPEGVGGPPARPS